MDNELTIDISEHAYKRFKQRNGWNKKTAKRMIGKIYHNGLRQKQIKGYKRQWFNYKIDNDDYNGEYVLYGEYVYVFRDNVLVTMFALPNRCQILTKCSA